MVSVPATSLAWRRMNQCALMASLSEGMSVGELFVKCSIVLVFLECSLVYLRGRYVDDYRVIGV